MNPCYQLSNSGKAVIVTCIPKGGVDPKYVCDMLKPPVKTVQYQQLTVVGWPVLAAMLLLTVAGFVAAKLGLKEIRHIKEARNV